jgi:UDP-GlcNAc:undecaprenyl-phosphate GlcNAc-1-phosphate transferase
MTSYILITGAGAFFVALALTPWIMWLCKRLSLYDRADARKVHKGEMPRLGGVSLFIATMSAIIFVAATLDTSYIPLSRTQLFAFLGGAILYFSLGLADDVYHLSAKLKFVLQIVFALGVAWAGISIGTLFGTVALPIWLNYFLTVFWIVGIVNTINFIDGLDGLSAGISAIAFLAILILSLARGDYFFCLASLAVLGALLGFLPYNFYPARIFIGDGGALLMGYLLASISLMGFFKQTALIAFILPLLILLVPIADTLFAILRRVAKHKPITAPDKKHIHHRVLFLVNKRYRQIMFRNGAVIDADTKHLIEGMAHRNTVLILYLVAAIFAAIAVLLGLRGL